MYNVCIRLKVILALYLALSFYSVLYKLNRLRGMSIEYVLLITAQKVVGLSPTEVTTVESSIKLELSFLLALSLALNIYSVNGRPITVLR